MMKRISVGGLALASLISQVAAQVPANKPTYWASVYDATVPVGMTDEVCLENPNGVRVRLLGVSVYGVGAATGTIKMSLVRRSSLDVPAASVTVTPTSSDERGAASAVIFRDFTANPTALGTLNGTFRQLRWDITTNGNNADPYGDGVMLTGNVAPVGQIPEIRAANTAICLNLNGPTIASTLTIDMVWTESAD
jgi:hypothetical protein